VDGALQLEDFNEQVGADVPSDEADTVGGFVFSLCGHQPEQGETVAWNGLRFTVDAPTDAVFSAFTCFKITQPHPEDNTDTENGNTAPVPEHAVE
jgi:Mg2+/Co2+ transporter CorC